MNLNKCSCGAFTTAEDGICADCVYIQNYEEDIDDTKDIKNILNIENIKNIENIEITDEIKEALDLMENTNESAFVTGPAGTGKTTLQKCFRKHTKKKVLVVAATGLAALNAGGQTIHSVFRLPPQFLTKSDVEKVYGTSLFKTIGAIAIEEVSMVRADMLDAIDLFMRLNGKNSNLPFGGVQLLLFGDLYQMPPVVDSECSKLIGRFYETPYFFSANVMKNFTLKKIELNKVFRQKDLEFINFLRKVRLGNISESDLEYINSRACNIKPTDDYVTLTPTNSIVSSINQKKLSELPDKLYTYMGRVEGKFDLGNNSSKNNNLPADFELRLKKGAKVMFVKNDSQGRWVNGTLGKIEELGDNFVKVRIDDDSFVVEVGAETWEKIKQEYDEVSNKIIAKVIGKYIQIPLKLAWALTIHKAQGQTLDKTYIDLSSGVWESGHTYVALSRCRTLNGIILKNKISLSDIKVDRRIAEFFKNKFSDNMG